jgi:hypothetical protein
MSDLQVYPISIPGGIEQSKPDPNEADLEELQNFGIFRNRIGLRPPISAIATLQDDQGSPQDVDAVLDIVEHEGKLWTASWSSSQQAVYLHSMQVDGTVLTLEAVLWTTVVAKPVVTLTSFAGGDASTGTSRLYATDYNQNLVTKYWDGATVQTLTVDLDASASAEDVYFSLMIPFKFHLWGTGFYEAAVTRPEMLRFSQPGLIPATDPALGTNPKEWFSADHRSVGRRGDKIIAVSKAGDRLIVFQKRATHAIYGSGANTWTRQELSDVIGCVGPHAVATVDERIAYFWASDGPYRTDGSQVQYIGQSIRQLAVDVDSDEIETRVGYSPDDGLVYFIVSPNGADEYSLALVFDHRRERWMKSQWLTGASTNLEFGALEFLDSVSSPGPAGTPSSLVASATSDSTMDLTWVNGDANINTETHIYRDTTTGLTPNDVTNRVATLSSGVETWTDTGLSAETTYYYKADHYRNSQHSGSVSNEANDETWLAEPTNMGLAGLTDGLTVVGDNNASGADVVIQRSPDGSTGWTTIRTEVTPGATFSYDDTGLVCDTTYYYRAMATKSGATDSEWSDVVSRAACNATVPPAAPTAPSATAIGENQIDLTWTDNSDNEDNFEIQRSFTSGSGFAFLVNKNANSDYHEDTGLTSDTTYYYRVRSTNNAGNSTWSSEVSDTTDPNLDAPTSLTATNPTISTIDLAWTENADDETGIEIYKTGPDVEGSYSLEVQIAANTNSHTVTGLGSNEQWWFKVRAVTATTNGPFSSSANNTTTGASAPATPANFTATKNVGSPTDTIDLAWDNVAGEDNFELQRKTGAGSFSTIATKGADVLTHADTPLTPGTSYTYRVRATNAVTGNSSWSAEDSDTTDGVASPPAAPSGLSVAGDDSDLNGIEKSAVDLSWTDNSDNEDNFEIERCTGASCTSWAALVTLGSDVESYTDTTVTDDQENNTIYRYRVRATNASFQSAWITSGDITVEPKVTPIIGTTVDTSYCDGPSPIPQLTVKWTNGGDQTGLEERVIKRSKNGASFTTVKTFTTSFGSEEWTDTGVTFGDSFRYRVEDDYGATGENTGVFDSGNSITKSPVDPDCPPDI